MTIAKLTRTIVDALEDVKAQEIKVFDVTGITELFDRVVIASGTSNRQTRALAMSVSEKVRDYGGSITAIEGLDTGEWVLVDCGDIVCHIMQPAIRSYYNLEELWGQVSVDLNHDIPVQKPRGVKKPAATKKPGTQKTAGKKSGTAKSGPKATAGKTPAAKTKATKSTKAPAKKAAATKTSTRAKPPTGTTSAKKRAVTKGR
jgi:ribosome-associated protein